MNALEMTRWEYCPRCGQREMRHREDAALECASCSYLYYHSAVAAVVGIVQHEDNNIITRRANDPGKGLLVIPGGFVEHGETLVRELHEELNLDVTDPRTWPPVPASISSGTCSTRQPSPTSS